MAYTSFKKPPRKTIDPYQAIARRGAENAALIVEEYSDAEYSDSPIEAVLLAALVSEIKTGFHEHTQIVLHERGEQFSRDDMTERMKFGLLLFVERQVQIAGWRVDFLISTPIHDGSVASLVVECDGHDFHERTKEQAAKDRARDREAQKGGYTIFRFTGSEIWRNPCGCADQIIDWAVDKACY